jgi:PBP1b-binding outer membrane lipoprotein LpoB
MLNILKLIFVASLCLSGCSSNSNRALYESIKTQNEINKSPVERAMTPSPSYSDYTQEREKLKLPD